ncbi:monooxygenase [Xanthomarina spongicola]|uniref:Putative monooxygenase ydhR n=1 Tax=Xanthomarina spongicola TaxID=570520 RepID=A0A316DPC9_9FLAO|nr:monooxygenase [Xanthomarina spongicola]PWK19815.1 putative monooxygenase ydhR [Xanthomarina spongicola]
MAVIMKVDFPHKEVWGKEMAVQMKELAQSIVNEPGFIWKFWTENKNEEIAGGVYMFDSRENAENYLKMHTNRLMKFGYSDIRGKVFEINEELSSICKAPL